MQKCVGIVHTCGWSVLRDLIPQASGLSREMAEALAIEEILAAMDCLYAPMPVLDVVPSCCVSVRDNMVRVKWDKEAQC